MTIPLPTPVGLPVPPKPVPVGQPTHPVDFFRRMPGGGTVFVKPVETRLPVPAACTKCRHNHHCPSCRACWPTHADACAYHPSRRPLPEPDGCAACDTPQRSHYQRWSPDVSWHGWIAPRNEVRLARMLARRAALSGPNTQEHAHG